VPTCWRVLGFGGLPLLLAHLGDDLVPMLEKAHDDDRATGLLWNIARRGGLDPDLRLEAAAAHQRLFGDAESLLAEIAVIDGMDWHSHMTADERAVDACDSAAARTALDMLKAVLQEPPAPDDDVLSRRLAELRDSR
jgi:hypothetical protein